jgi:hypothetical protein
MNLSRLRKAEFLKTLESRLTTNLTVLIDNEPYSNSTYLIKSLDFTNASAVDETVNVWFVRNGLYTEMLSSFLIPAKASLNALGNDIALYLEPGDAIVAQSSTANNTIKVVCNYIFISGDPFVFFEKTKKSYENFFDLSLDIFGWANEFTPTNMNLNRNTNDPSPVGQLPLSINVVDSNSSLNSFNVYSGNLNIAFAGEKWLIEFYAKSDVNTEFTLEIYGALANGNASINNEFYSKTFDITTEWIKYKFEVEFFSNDTSFIQINFKGKALIIDQETILLDNLRIQRVGPAVLGFNVLGGSETVVNDIKYHTFNSTDQIFVAGYPQLNALVVAGGGGGGMAFASTPRQAGGGGAGGLRNLAASPTTGIYNVIVGSGGSGSTNINNQGSDGSNSSVFDIVSTGGGGGGSTNVPREGRNGGSGGGGARNATNFASGGSGISGQGFNGGTSTSNGSGGGGGAGGVGSVTNGGIGVIFNGSTYAVGGDGTDTSTFADGLSAGINTGSGGDGGSTGGIGGNGGSGIVIVYYEV